VPPPAPPRTVFVTTRRTLRTATLPPRALERSSVARSARGNASTPQSAGARVPEAADGVSGRSPITTLRLRSAEPGRVDEVISAVDAALNRTGVPRVAIAAVDGDLVFSCATWSALLRVRVADAMDEALGARAEAWST